MECAHMPETDTESRTRKHRRDRARAARGPRNRHLCPRETRTERLPSRRAALSRTRLATALGQPRSEPGLTAAGGAGSGGAAAAGQERGSAKGLRGQPRAGARIPGSATARDRKSVV